MVFSLLPPASSPSARPLQSPNAPASPRIGIRAWGTLSKREAEAERSAGRRCADGGQRVKQSESRSACVCGGGLAPAPAPPLSLPPSVLDRRQSTHTRHRTRAAPARPPRAAAAPGVQCAAAGARSRPAAPVPPPPSSPLASTLTKCTLPSASTMGALGSLTQPPCGGARWNWGRSLQRGALAASAAAAAGTISRSIATAPVRAPPGRGLRASAEGGGGRGGRQQRAVNARLCRGGGTRACGVNGTATMPTWRVRSVCLWSV